MGFEELGSKGKMVFTI